MKKILLSATALVVAGAFALTGCSSERGGDTGSGSGDEAKGFAADATIGVALPDKTSENWVLAGQLFTDGLKKAGFKPDVQYAPASNTVAEQQNQIQAMVTGGAKVIIIGAKDGKQLSTQVEAARDAGVTVIAYDRLIENTEAVGPVVVVHGLGVLDQTVVRDDGDARASRAASTCIRTAACPSFAPMMIALAPP